MSPAPDIHVVVAPAVREVKAVVKPVATVSVVVEPPEILVIGNAPLGPQGPAGTVGPFYAGHTYAVIGLLSTVTVLPAFFVPKHPTQTVKLSGIMADLATGSVKLQLQRNGANVGPLLTLGQTAVWTSLGDVVLNHGDKISALLSGHANAPATLSATVALEWSVL